MSKNPNYVLNSPWDAKEKQLARIVSITELYRHIFNRKSIPEDKQYWTLCGAHTKGEEVLKGELGHLTEMGLIHHKQYFGVDREKIIIDNNQKHSKYANWINDDFIDAMKKAIYNKTFNPSIINYDGVMQPNKSIGYLKRILSLLDYNISEEVMVIANFVLHNPYTSSELLRYTIYDTFNLLAKQHWFPNHWNIFCESYSYKHSQAKMGIMVFVKEKHNIDDIQYTPKRKIGQKA